MAAIGTHRRSQRDILTEPKAAELQIEVVDRATSVTPHRRSW
jgi:hypothetical protein